MRLEIDFWRWTGVPFPIRAGKCLPVTATEVLVKLRQPPLGKLIPGSNLSINLGARIKRPGFGMESLPAELSAMYDSDVRAQAGVDLATIAAILGHSKLTVVERCIHVTEQHQRSEMLRYDTLLQGAPKGQGSFRAVVQ